MRKVLLVTGLGYWVYLYVTTIDERPASFRLAITGALSVVFVILFATIFAVLLRVSARSQLRRLLPPGEVLTSRFGPDSVALSGRLSSTDLAYEGFDWIARSGSWVVFRHGGSRAVHVCPEEIFPDDEVARIEAVMAQRDQVAPGRR